MLDDSFAMAFGLQSWNDRTYLNDPRYVKWVLRYTVEIDHNKNEKWYPLHRCTERDYRKFYSPSSKFEKEVELLKQSDALFCFDWRSMPIQIWGEKGSLDFAQFDVMAIPCHMKVTLDQGQFEIENLNECVWDKD